MATSAAHLSHPSPNSSAPVLDFMCLFTHDLKRKQKRWQDGRLKYHTFNKRVMVYDERGNFVGDMHWRHEWDLDEGEEISLERGGMIVQVSECTGRQDQDLSGLLDKRAKEKEQRHAKVVSRSVAPSPAHRPVHVSHAKKSVDTIKLRQRPLNQSIATPAAQPGRALIPTDSPFEQEHGTKKGPGGEEEEEKRARKRRKANDSPPSRMGYAQSLFGTQLTLSAVPTTFTPLRRTRAPVDPEEAHFQQFGMMAEENEQDWDVSTSAILPTREASWSVPIIPKIADLPRPAPNAQAYPLGTGKTLIGDVAIEPLAVAPPGDYRQEGQDGRVARAADMDRCQVADIDERKAHLDANTNFLHTPSVPRRRQRRSDKRTGGDSALPLDPLQDITALDMNKVATAERTVVEDGNLASLVSKPDRHEEKPRTELRLRSRAKRGLLIMCTATKPSKGGGSRRKGGTTNEEAETPEEGDTLSSLEGRCLLEKAAAQAQCANQHANTKAVDAGRQSIDMERPDNCRRREKSAELVSLRDSDHELPQVPVGPRLARLSRRSVRSKEVIGFLVDSSGLPLSPERLTVPSPLVESSTRLECSMIRDEHVASAPAIPASAATESSSARPKDESTLRIMADMSLTVKVPKVRGGTFAAARADGNTEPATVRAGSGVTSKSTNDAMGGTSSLVVSKHARMIAQDGPVRDWNDELQSRSHEAVLGPAEEEEQEESSLDMAGNETSIHAAAGGRAMVRQESAASKARITNPASRGRKAALRSDAAGQVPKSILPVEQVTRDEARRGDSARFAAGAAEEGPKRKMTFPGFMSVKDAGPWSREAYDLLETGRPC